MEYTNIPSIKKKASRMGLGTWAIGGGLWGGTDEQQSIQTIISAVEHGINFIDTAPAYGNGTSETIVGKALQQIGQRDKIIVATKCGLNLETSNVFRDTSRKSIMREIEESLNRLQVDYIDLYQIHWPDPTTPMNETAEAMLELLNQGKISAIGVSNFTIDQIEEFRNTAPVHSVQPPFNLFEREAENELIGYCLQEDLAIIGYSALCRGLLSGKMNKEREFKGDDLRKGMDPKFQAPRFSQYLSAAEHLKRWVKDKYDRPLTALAIRWVLDSDVNIALWGARKPEQLRDVNAALNWELTAADFHEIDKIIQEHVKDPIEPTFMGPPVREKVR